MRYVWRLIDRLLVRIYGIKPLLSDNTGILAIEQRRYKGEDLGFSDGNLICNGAAVVILHSRSSWFMQHYGEDALKVMLEGLRCVQRELRLLAEKMQEGEFAQVEALMCTTFFFDLFARMGFELWELPQNLHTRLSAFYMSKLRESYYPKDKGSLVQYESTLKVKQGWMHRNKFVLLYGKGKYNEVTR